MQPSLNLIPTIQQAIVDLLTTREPVFLQFGYTLFMAFATILIAWHGIRMMFSHEGLGDHRPVFLLQHPALAADDFAHVDDVDRRIAERCVEIERRATLPQVEDRSDRKFHRAGTHCQGRW